MGSEVEGKGAIYDADVLKCGIFFTLGELAYSNEVRIF
jgi:hypothetical protein